MDPNPVVIIESPKKQPEEKLETNSQVAETAPKKDHLNRQSSTPAKTHLAPASGHYVRHTQSVKSHVPSNITSRTSVTRQLSAASKENKVAPGNRLGKASSVSTSSLQHSNSSISNSSKSTAANDRYRNLSNRKADARRTQSTSDLTQARSTDSIPKTVTKTVSAVQKTEPNVFTRLYRTPQRTGRANAGAAETIAPTASRAKSMSNLSIRATASASSRKLSTGGTSSGLKCNPPQRRLQKQASGGKVEEAPPTTVPLTPEALTHPSAEATQIRRPSVARMRAQGTRIPRPARQNPQIANSRSKSVTSQFVS
ncbi:unnamed protein product [Dibothriocephalus latus]|uniref:Uncharacterized protein n=1 Tax=Dibothriocephalus latus TaxID=60516 RepID=A0A3P6PFU0_DIBLA|nr:unnamed protein product [Dibothriocephalus latus]